MKTTHKNDIQKRIESFPDKKLLQAFKQLESYNQEAQLIIEQEIQIRKLTLPKEEIILREELEEILVNEPVPVPFSSVPEEEEQIYYHSIEDIPFVEKNGEKIFFQTKLNSSKSFAGKMYDWKTGMIWGGIFGMLIILMLVVVGPDSEYFIYYAAFFILLFAVMMQYFTDGVANHQLVLKQKISGQSVALIDSLFEINFNDPFSYQWYNEFISLNGVKRIYLYVAQQEQGFAIADTLHPFQSFPSNCLVASQMSPDTIIYYPTGLKKYQTKEILKILNTISNPQ